ncbi:MAG TPA: hypothetical protein VEG27_09030, partial [Usitatibacter sp.]|nr:hypothetical protein [Usitatibacter sp.]
MRIGALLLLLLCAPAFAADEDRSIVVGGTTRTYRIHLPNGRAPGTPVPLVVVFHGGGGNAAN